MLALLALGLVLLHRGPEAWGEAARCLRLAAQLAEAIGSRVSLAAARLGAAEIAAVRGDKATAVGYLQQTIDISRALGLGYYLPRAQATLDEVEVIAEAAIGAVQA
jgi:hypothetical protein